VSHERSGKVALGCLVVLLLASAAAYFGVNAGRVYWRFYQFQDAMTQEARFAPSNTNELIVSRLRAKADSLGLPEAAQKVHIRRERHHTDIWAEYIDTIELPGHVREVSFEPHVERAF